MIWKLTQVVSAFWNTRLCAAAVPPQVAVAGIRRLPTELVKVPMQVAREFLAIITC